MSLDKIKECQTLDQLLQCLNSVGMQIEELEIDGKYKKFIWGQDDITKKGSYRATQTALGIEFEFRHWKNTHLNFNFTFGSENFSIEDFLLHSNRVYEQREAESRRKQIKWDSARLVADQKWSYATETKDHSYLYKKRLKSAYGTRACPLGTLYIPACDNEGVLWSLQSITPDHKKMNLDGGKLKGTYHLIGDVSLDSPIYICEGFATAATLHEATGFACAVSFSANFMISCAETIRLKYPESVIIFSGDADEAGKKSAKKASKMVKNSKFLWPFFKSPHPDYTDWNDLFLLDGIEAVISQIDEFHKEQAQNPDPEQAWLYSALKKYGFKCFYDGRVEWEGNSRVGLNDICNDLFLRSRQEFVPCGKPLIWSLLESTVQKEKNKYYEGVIDSLFKTHTNACGEVESFVRAITDDATDETIAIFKHFLWQVKRRALGLPIYDHMMIVLVGAERSGKSTACRKLIEPLGALISDASLDMCSDDRNYNLFINNLVVFFDEMAKAEKTNLPALKKLITAPVVTFRLLGTNLHKTHLNLSTLIGTSNESLADLIQDPYSTRRFYEITSKSHCDWDAINSIDYENMWRSAEAEEKSPYDPFKEEVRKIQATFKHVGDVENALISVDFQKDDVPHLLLSTFYEDIYVPYCRDNHIKFIRTKAQVSLQLKNLGIKVVRLKTSAHRDKAVICVLVKGHPMIYV